MKTLSNNITLSLKLSLLKLTLLCFMLLSGISLPANAARIIQNVLLDGGTVTHVEAEATISVTITVETTGNGNGANNRWRSTGYRIGSDGDYDCNNHDNESGAGTYTKTFDITAPSNSGTYDVSFYAYRNDSCTQGASDIELLSDGVNVSMCAAEFSDGMQNNDTEGYITFEEDGKIINSPNNILDSYHSIAGDAGWQKYTCDSVDCTSSGSISSPLAMTDFGSGVLGDISYDASDGAQHLLPGQYTNLNLDYHAELTLEAGDYYFDGNFTSDSQKDIVISGDSTAVVRIFVKGNVDLGYVTGLNKAGSSNQLLLYSGGNISLGNGVEVSGLIYSQGNTTLDFQSIVNGAISAKNITQIGNQSVVNFPDSIPDFCDIPTPPPTTVDYCETTFLNGLTTYADGEVRILGDGERAIFNDRNGLLRTNNLNDDDDELICGDIVSSGSTQVCARDTVNEDTVPLADIPFIPGSGGSNISDVATAITLGSGSYDTDTFDNITVNDGGNITFSSDYSTYYINKLEVLGDNNNGTSATITFAPGDYYINEFDTFQNTTILSSGTVRVIIQQSSEFRGSTQINVGGAPEDFLIYNGDDDIRLYDSSEVHALLYAENTVGFNEENDSSTVKLVGAASAGERINLGENTEVYYTCDPYIEPVVTATTEYRFDELFYTGTAEEIVDTIAGANGSAIESQPVAGKVCNAIDLSAVGVDDYAILDESVLSTKSDFTISLWSKTAKTGNSSVISGANSSTANELLMFFESDEEFALHLIGDDPGDDPMTSIAGDVWRHLVWTRQGSENCLYIDTVSQGCQTLSTDQLSIQSLILGQDQDSVFDPGNDDGGFDSDQGLEGLIDELVIFDEALSSPQIKEIYNNQNQEGNFGYDGIERTCPTLDPLLYMQFDEVSWTGDPAEVIDVTGNFNGQAINGATTGGTEPAIEGDPGTCRYGSFDGNNQYVALPSEFENHNGSFTITAWIKPSNLSPGSRIFADDENNTGGYALSLGDSNNGHLRFYSRGVEPIIVDTTSVVTPVDQWTFVTAVHNADNKTREIYVNGVAQTVTGGDIINTYTGSWGTDPGIATIGGESDDGETNNRFTGNIDEVRFYNRALSAEQIDEVYQETHPCDVYIDHFEIDTYDAAGLTCEPDLIKIKACSDPSCASLYEGDDVEVDLLVSDDNGSEVLNKDVSFSTGEADVSYINTTAGNFTLSLAPPDDSNYTCDNGVSTSCDVTFSDAGFKFIAVDEDTGSLIPIPTQLSGKPSNTGYNASTLIIEAVQNDDSNLGVCAPLLIDEDGPDIQLAAAYVSPSSNTDLDQVNISGAAIETASSVVSYTSVALGFGSDGLDGHQAPYVFTYPNAGSIQLQARYQLPDDEGNLSDEYITGSTTSPIVVRPFAFYISVDTELDTGGYKDNPGVTNANDEDGVFTVAAGDFRVTTSAVAWELGDDVNVNGVADEDENLSDNAITTNFTGVALTSLVHAKVEPVNGEEDGVLSISSGSFSVGTQVDIVSYDEVGIISLDATYEDYLSSDENIVGNVAHVGRFTPDHFTVETLVDGVIWSTCDTTSSATSLPFAYSGQMLLDDLNNGALGYSSSPGVVLQARNKDDKITRNYVDDFMKLTEDSFTRESINEAGVEVFAPFEDGTQLGKDSANKVRIDSLLGVDSFTNANGEITYSYNDADNFVYKHEENSEIIEFEADIDLPMVSIIDDDGIVTVDDDGDDLNGLIFTLNPTAPSIRFGRAELDNTYGPDTADLPQRLSVTYLTESGYKVSNTDTCTSYNSDNVALTEADEDPLDLTKTSVKDNVSGTFYDELPFGETRDILLTAPTTNVSDSNTGSVCVSYDVFPWLQYLWAVDEDNLQCAYSDVDGLFNDNPHAIATFGLFRGNDRIIYQREIAK